MDRPDILDRLSTEVMMADPDRGDLAAQLQQIMATLMLQGAITQAALDVLVEDGIVPREAIDRIFATAEASLVEAREVGVGASSGTVDLALAQVQSIRRGRGDG